MNLFLVVWKSRDESGEFLAVVSVAPAAFLSEESAHIYAETNLVLAPADSYQVVAVGMDPDSLQESIAQEAMSAMQSILATVNELTARVVALEAR